MSLVIDLIDLVAKHKSGELRCPATALILKAVLCIARDCHIFRTNKIPTFDNGVGLIIV